VGSEAYWFSEAQYVLDNKLTCIGDGKMQMQQKVPCCAVFNWSFDFVSWSFKEIDHDSFTLNCPLKSWISFAIHIGSPVGSACEPIHTYCVNPSIEVGTLLQQCCVLGPK
jgi:hypothetical protein